MALVPASPKDSAMTSVKMAPMIVAACQTKPALMSPTSLEHEFVELNHSRALSFTGRVFFFCIRASACFLLVLRRGCNSPSPTNVTTKTSGVCTNPSLIQASNQTLPTGSVNMTGLKAAEHGKDGSKVAKTEFRSRMPTPLQYEQEQDSIRDQLNTRT